MKVMLPPETNEEFSAPLLFRLVLALGMTLLCAACTSQPARQQAAITQVANGEEECRSEPVTGSDFTRRTCRTAEEWAVIDGKREPVQPGLPR